MRPTWIEVSRAALRRNFQLVRRHVGPATTICAVVKADGYGHGACECARVLEEEGATWFGVTSTEEGVQLRRAGIRGRILLMSGFWSGEEEDVLRHQLVPALWEPRQIEELEAAALRLPDRPPHPVHLKINTGMARLGADPGQVPEVLRALEAAPHIVLEGVFSHLASSEIVDTPDVEKQIVCFRQVVAQIRAAGFSPALIHIANSAAMATRRESWMDMVRPGLALFGYFLPLTSLATGQADAGRELPVEAALSWKARIMALRQVPGRQPVGYGGAYITAAPALLAVMPVGYADGLSRSLSSCGRVIVRNTYAAMVGNISMDLTILDVTRVPGVSVGDEIILIGASADCKITAWEHARFAATVPYDILCSIGKRVPRFYLD
jgi:alanine racemase